MRSTFGLACIALLAALSVSDAAVLCGKQRADGTFNSSVKVREACRPREVQLDPASVGMCCTPPTTTSSTSTTTTTLLGSVKIVFGVYLLSSGSLGGLAGADATCNSHAAAAGLPGTYKAWLADGTDAPATRFTHATVPYVRVDGVVVANDWTDLTDGTLDAPIALNENGDSVNMVAWTNVTGAGTVADPSPSKHCSGWTNGTAGFHGGRGFSLVSASDGWTNGGDVVCTVLSGLYCFQQ